MILQTLNDEFPWKSWGTLGQYSSFILISQSHRVVVRIKRELAHSHPEFLEERVG